MPGISCERHWAVDVVELNTILDRSGTVTLRQVVLWRYREYRLSWDYYVVAWELTEKCSVPELMPNGRWLVWMRGRWYSARVLIVTDTDKDWELIDRGRMPVGDRR